MPYTGSLCLLSSLLALASLLTGTGQVIAKSTVAGSYAVAETSSSRLIMAGSALFIPPVLMSMMGASTWFWMARMPVELIAIAMGCGGILPVAVAMFPQKGSLKTEDLEPPLQGLKTEEGEPIDTVYYNKGI